MKTTYAGADARVAILVDCDNTFSKILENAHERWRSSAGSCPAAYVAITSCRHVHG